MKQVREQSGKVEWCAVCGYPPGVTHQRPGAVHLALKAQTDLFGSEERNPLQDVALSGRSGRSSGPECSVSRIARKVVVCFSSILSDYPGTQMDSLGPLREIEMHRDTSTAES